MLIKKEKTIMLSERELNNFLPAVGEELSVVGLARLWGLSEFTIRNLIGDKSLQAGRNKNRHAISRSQALMYLQTYGIPQPGEKHGARHA
jgi:hypothetical protein